MNQNNSQPDFASLLEAWRYHSTALADLTLTHLVNRVDTSVRYTPAAYRDEHPLTREKLLQHFIGCGNRVGLYTTDPTDSRCRWLCIDIDAHAEERADNFTLVLNICDELQRLGIVPIVEDSNGGGGWHVWVVFGGKMHASWLRRFGWWLCRNRGETAVEVFPKQDSISPDGFGNVVRLPGKHHKREHWSGFYDPATGELYQGTAAPGFLVRSLASAATNDTSRIPAEVIDVVPPGDTPLPEFAEDDHQGGELIAGADVRLAVARGHLANCRGSTVGRGASDYALALACYLVCDCALDPDEALPVFVAWGLKGDNRNESGEYDPWTEKELRHKLKAAAKKTAGQPRGSALKRVPIGVLVGEDRIAELTAQAPTEVSPEPAPKPAAELVEPPAVVAAASVEDKAVRKKRGYRISELDCLPEAQFIIRDHLTAMGCNLLYGASGSYKSFIALDMSMSVSTGLPYLGLYPVNQGNVVYICSEGSAGIKRRVRGWLQHHGVKKAPDNIIFIPHAFDLMKPEEATAIKDIIREDLAAKPDLIVIDTLARNFGGDENATQDMNEYVRVTDLFSNVGARLHVHHSGWGDTRRERGSSVLRGAADTILAVEKGDDNRVLVSCRKAKDSEPFVPYYLKPVNMPDHNTLAFDYDGSTADDAAKVKLTASDKVVKLLAENPFGFSSDVIAEKCGFGRDTARMLISSMKTQSVVYYDPKSKTNKLVTAP